jgi:hypothetical protein
MLRQRKSFDIGFFVKRGRFLCFRSKISKKFLPLLPNLLKNVSMEGKRH